MGPGGLGHEVCSQVCAQAPAKAQRILSRLRTITLSFAGRRLSFAARYEQVEQDPNAESYAASIKISDQALAQIKIRRQIPIGIHFWTGPQIATVPN
jgi:hypothetical protein